MQTVSTIGLDIAKSLFQVHGIDAAGQVVIRRQLKRRYLLAFFEKLPPCLIGIEACASSHHWSRELRALGHTVRLMPPAYVKPYVKRQKNDMADAEAICEAVTRTNMRFVPTKTPEQAGWCSIAPAIWLSASRPQSSMRSGVTLPSLASSHRSDAKASRNCYVSSPIRATNGCPMLCVHALLRWAANCSTSKSRSWILIE